MRTRQTDQDVLREQVRARYAAAATKVTSGDCGGGDGCCGAAATAEAPGSAGAELYAALDRDQLPDSALLASLGCGNPTAVADLHQGKTVLDLARVAASTCCCPRGGSAQRARPMGWT